MKIMYHVVWNTYSHTVNCMKKAVKETKCYYIQNPGHGETRWRKDPPDRERSKWFEDEKSALDLAQDLAVKIRVEALKSHAKTLTHLDHSIKREWFEETEVP